MAKHSNVLLLGMVFSSEAIPKRGQEYRDRVRCEALERLNYKVKTLDNKHSDITLLNHCTANFSDTRRMVKAITSKWGSETFDHVILDYFMSPVGWARTRWTDPLFTATFPTLARSGLLAPGAKIWLPNMQCIEQSLEDFKAHLEPYFNIYVEKDSLANPLYLATEDAEEELLLCPDLITNSTQAIPLKSHAGEIGLFYVLELREVMLDNFSSSGSNTSSRKRRKLTTE
eukprot:gene28287-31947_t